MSHIQDEDPGLPIKWNPCSNGEFVPGPPSDLVLAAARRARALSERNARLLGMSRRHFLLSSAGAATALWSLAACSSEKNKATGTETGGTFDVSEEATVDTTAAREVVDGEEFIFDVQGHFLQYPADSTAGTPQMFPQSACGASDPRDCYRYPEFMKLMFSESDTSMLVLSCIPFGGQQFNPDVMAEAIRISDELCGDGRVLMQGEAHPNTGELSQALDNMAQISAAFPVGAWKVYTHSPGPGWFLDDHDPDSPAVGEAFLDKVTELGPPIVAVHKGFAIIGGVEGAKWSDPVDIGPAASNHPDLSFVVYHSGFEPSTGPEGPYNPDQPLGIDRLIASAEAHDIGPGGNIYAELGSTWRFLMGDPDQAAHAIGKLLVAFGEDNVVWGTDSIWYGSPQDQIQSFRTFEITQAFQEQYGYPALTKEIKAKIFGLNSSALYGVDPIAGRCDWDPEQMEDIRLTSTVANHTLGPVTPAEVFAVARAELAAIEGTRP